MEREGPVHNPVIIFYSTTLFVSLVYYFRNEAETLT
jgi:hypothetical protein